MGAFLEKLQEVVRSWNKRSKMCLCGNRKSVIIDLRLLAVRDKVRE